MTIAAAVLWFALGAQDPVVSSRESLGAITRFTVSIHGIDEDARTLGVSEKGVKDLATAQLRGCVPLGGPAATTGNNNNPGIIGISYWVGSTEPRGAMLIQVSQMARIATGQWVSATTYTFIHIVAPPSVKEELRWDRVLSKGLQGVCAAYAAGRKALAAGSEQQLKAPAPTP